MLATLYVVRMLGLFMVLPLIAIYSADLEGATPFLLGLAVGAPTARPSKKGVAPSRSAL